MKVEVTVIIAAYNAEATIERALKSVKSQNFENWECLIIDGASKDKTIEIVQKLLNQILVFNYFQSPIKEYMMPLIKDGGLLMVSGFII